MEGFGSEEEKEETQDMVEGRTDSVLQEVRHSGSCAGLEKVRTLPDFDTKTRQDAIGDQYAI